ncbi:MAG: DUF3179 domain-containing protein [Deltaproteobacteria bacterium]|jgi:hypothetical protein|nr:DUF3179 domain-containing protein [Deltaproteobacteria bacterium]
MAALTRHYCKKWILSHLLLPGLFCLALSAGQAIAAEAPPSPSSADEFLTEIPGFSIDDLDFLARELSVTGMGSDGIPPVYRPVFVRVSDAGLSMDDREPVFVVHYPGGLTRVYPQSIMVWHEIVNDVVPDPNSAAVNYRPGGERAESPGNAYTVTYSPLTGCVTVFKSRAGRYPSTFGNDGRLLNANLTMYDRTSGGIWSQLLAVCLEGPLRGKRLERYPVYWARWGGVRNRYPDAEVLSRSTGYRRNYGRDPYGSYFSEGTYYSDTQIYHQVSRLSDLLPPKTRVLGLEMESIYGALLVDAVRESKVLNQTLGIFKLTAFYDDELDRVRVFDSRLSDGTLLEFRLFENKFRDRNTNSEWNSDGECVYGRLRGTSLKPILAVDAMWFAWYAFHPDTQVLGKGEEPKRRGPDIPY